MDASLRAEPVAVDLINARLRRGTETVSLRPKDAAVLHQLLLHAGQLVAKDALIAAAWPRVSVTEAVLKACINRLRTALGDDPRAPRFIETVHGFGYRFVGDRRWSGRRLGQVNGVRLERRLARRGSGLFRSAIRTGKHLGDQDDGSCDEHCCAYEPFFYVTFHGREV